MLPLKLIFESWIDRISISGVYKKATGLKLSALSVEERGDRGEFGLAFVLAELAHQHVLVREGRVSARLGWAGEIDRAGEASPTPPMFGGVRKVEGLLKR